MPRAAGSTPSRQLYSRFLPLGSLEGALCKVKGLCWAEIIPGSSHSNKKNGQLEEEEEEEMEEDSHF